MQQHDSKYLPPSPTLVMGSIGQTSTFSEHGHVAYQIKGNHQMEQHGSKYFRESILNIECHIEFDAINVRMIPFYLRRAGTRPLYCGIFRIHIYLS